MFQLKLYNSSLTIQDISRGSKTIDSGDECPYSPHFIHPQRYIKLNEKTQNQLKKNYNLMVLDKGSYVIYNQKNQAIIDNSILAILNRFDIQEIGNNTKLIEILYKLEFIRYE